MIDMFIHRSGVSSVLQVALSELLLIQQLGRLVSFRMFIFTVSLCSFFSSKLSLMFLCYVSFPYLSSILMKGVLLIKVPLLPYQSVKVAPSKLLAVLSKVQQLLSKVSGKRKDLFVHIALI